MEWFCIIKAQAGLHHTQQCTTADNMCHQATHACKASLPSDMGLLEAPTRWVGSQISEE